MRAEKRAGKRNDPQSDSHPDPSGDPSGDPHGGTRAGYDRVADAYAARFLDELAHKPLDRLLLDLVAVRVGAAGRVADVGCGPGHVTRYLHERGADPIGVDLSPRMVEVAAAAHPGIDFRQGDMRALPVPDQALAGLVAFYSIIHVPPAELPDVAREFFRVLRPGGVALLSFHLGDELRHLDEFLDHPVALDFQFYRRAEVQSALAAAGFQDEAYVERRSYDSEVSTTRAYLLAGRPG